MEYLIGSLMTLAMLLVMNRIMSSNKIYKDKFSMPLYSQARLDSMVSMSQYRDTIINFEYLETQATRHFQSLSMKVVLRDDVAYWIKDGAFYCADIIDGQIQLDSEKRVDIMSMNKVQLDDMMHIVEQLTEGGQDDSNSSGN